MKTNAKQSPTEHVSAGPECLPDAVLWLENTLPLVMRRLVDSEDLEIPYFQLPLAQMRLAQALYRDPVTQGEESLTGDTMGQLSERLGVRQNALCQAADRLISRGLAARFSDVHDRRLVRLRLTLMGQAWVEERHARRRAHLARLWGCLSEKERQDFLNAVQTLVAVGERSRGGPATPPCDVTGDVLDPDVETLSFARDTDELHRSGDASASETNYGRM